MDKALKRVHGPFSSLYEEAGLPKAFRRSLNFIFIGNLCGLMQGIICGSGTTSSVGFMTSLGASDLHFGIVSGIAQAVALLQLPFSMIVNRTHHRKKYILTVGVISRVVWLFAGFIPLLVPATPEFLRLWSFILLVTISFSGGAMVNVCWFPWFSDLCPLRIRGRWLSIKDMISAGLQVLFGLLIAWLLDTLPPETRYIVIFLIGGTIGTLDMLCFGFCKEVYSAPPKSPKVKDLLHEIFTNRPFMRFLIMWTLWLFASNMSAIYYFPYTMNSMGLTAMQLMIFATVTASVATILMIQRWGKALFRYGGKNVMTVTIGASVLMPLFFLFETPGSVIPLFLYHFLGNLFFCGSNLAASSMQLALSPDDTRPTYVAIFSCVTSVIGGTLSSLLSGFALETMERNHLFEGFFDRYKMMFVISVILRLAVFLIFVPRLEQDSGVEQGTPKDVLRSLIPHRRKR